MVVFDSDAFLAGHSRGRMFRLGRALQGADASLPDNYGMSAEELAALLNQYRSKALG